MATKKIDTKSKGAKAASKDPSSRVRNTTKAKAVVKTAVVKKAKGETVKVSDRHPRARVLAAHGGKEALAKSLASTLARAGEDTDALATQLKTASNKQLLRLAAVSATVKQKWGGRDGLITKLAEAAKKGKDQDYLTKLGTYSLPQLLDLATASARRARA